MQQTLQLLDSMNGYSTYQDQKLGSEAQHTLEMTRDFNKFSYKPLTLG